MVRKIRSAHVAKGAPVQPEELSKYFNGELMTCILCGRQQLSDPEVNLQWRAIEADGVPYYACPAEFPPDSAGREAFKQAYMKVLNAIVATRRV